MEKSEILMHQLYRTTRIIAKGLNQILEPYGLYSSEWGIVATLKDQGPMTQGALAAFLHIEPPAISTSLAKLEKKGYIERKAGTDKREKKVFLTEEALRHYSTWAELAGQHRHAVLQHLSDQKQHELYVLLQAIFQDAQQYQGGLEK